MDHHSDESNGNWQLCGRTVPKSEIVFFAQVILIYIVVFVSIFNLTYYKDDSKLWISLLSANIGYLLPCPTLKRNK